MNNFVSAILIASIFSFGAYKYNGSTLPATILAGGIIKAQNTNVDKKVKRKDCKVCEGKGWYISGDKITKVPCGYCEPDKQAPQKITIHPPVIINQSCPEGNCPSPNVRK